MQEQLELDEAPTVTCPDSDAIEQDAVTTCTAELNGESVDVQVNWKVVP